jgi:CHAT domain-containing protein/Tfp pilus assembly protein PilF
MRFLLCLMFTLSVATGFSQTNTLAKALYLEAINDTTASRDSLAAVKFYQSAKEESKVGSADKKFIAHALFTAAKVAHERAKTFKAAHQFYYEALDAARSVKDNNLTGEVYRQLGSLYVGSVTSSDALNFPASKEKETKASHFSVLMTRVSPKNPNEHQVIYGGGFNDGIVQGSEGTIYGTKKTDQPDRNYILLGKIKNTDVRANYTIGIAEFVNPTDSLSRAVIGDVVEVPIRVSKKQKEDLLDYTVTYGIHILDNDLSYIVHPRTLLHNQSPELYPEVYGAILQQIRLVWDLYKDRATAPFTTNIDSGRFKGKTLIEALRDLKEDDLHAFMSYMITYPAGYMGTYHTRFSERIAGWIISGAPMGAFEAMDSLLKLSNNEVAFNSFVKKNRPEIVETFFGQWKKTIQDYAINDHPKANAWTAALMKTASSLKSDSLLAWAHWMSGYVHGEQKQNDKAVEQYKKAIEIFKKKNDLKGLSFATNNIGSQLSSQYKYKEAKEYFEQVVNIRKKHIQMDTTETAKVDLAAGYLAVAAMLRQEGKYKEAIQQLKTGLPYLEKLTSVNAKSKLSNVYNHIAYNYKDMGDFEEAAKYYDLEFTTRAFLGEDEGMADAYDNKADLLSRLGRNRDALETYFKAFKLHESSGNTGDAGFSMSNIGQAYWRMGKFDSAIMAHKHAIKLRKQAEDLNGEAYSWKKLGQLHNESGNSKETIEAFNMALKLYEDAKNEEERASVLKEFASFYKNQKDYNRALDYNQRALAIYKKTKSKIDIADSWHQISSVLYANLQFHSAEKYNDSALTLQQEIDNQSGLVYTYQQKASLQQYYRGDLKAALNYTQLALMLASKTTSESDIAFSMSALGTIYDNLGKYDSAIHYYNLAANIYQKLEDRSNVADVMISKGYHYGMLAIYDSAQVLFQQALEIGKHIKDKRLIANAYDGLSNLESTYGNFSKAFEYNHKVVELWKEQQNPWGVAYATLITGNIHNYLSNFKQAIETYHYTDSIYNRLGLDKARATPINNIATIYFYQKDYSKALQEFKRALSILQKTNDDPRFISLIKSNIGEVYAELKNYEQGEKWLNDAIKMARDIGNVDRQFEPLMILARLKTSTGKYAEAAKLFRDASSILNSSQKASVVQLETEFARLLLLQKDYAGAEKKLSNVVKVSNEIGLRTYVWKAHAMLADIRDIENKKDEAVKQLEQAIKVVEELKERLSGGAEARKTFSNDESIVSLYQRMAKLLKDLGRKEEALSYIEKSNVENLNLRLRADGNTTTDADQASLANDKKAELVKLEKEKVEELSKPAELQSAEKLARLDKMQTIAERDYNDFIIKVGAKEAREFRGEKKYIPQDVALLSYLVTEDQLSIFIVMKDSLLVKDIPVNRKLLEKKITQFYNAHANHSKKSRRGLEDDQPEDASTVDVERLNYELYELLLLPARDAISSKKRVAIVPSNLLSFLPFHALRPSGAQANYFGDDKQVFYVNKIFTVTNGRNAPFTDLKIIAAGNADHSLENAAIEVKKLSKQFPSAKVYIGNEATKSNVLGTPGDYNILHLATHGVMDYNDVRNSYLVFAIDKNASDDGKLKIKEIDTLSNLKRFSMVTLSACETAIVQNIKEGWPISTASAFVEAGVPTVIATLWKVADKPTSILMERFYSNMKTMDKVAALQEAQKYLRSQKEYADPFYWAPFQLVGLWQ